MGRSLTGHPDAVLDPVPFAGDSPGDFRMARHAVAHAEEGGAHAALSQQRQQRRRLARDESADLRAAVSRGLEPGEFREKYFEGSRRIGGGALRRAGD